MALKTVVVISSVCIRCGGASGPEVIPGDTVQLFLDQEANPDFPEWIEGTVINVAPQTVSSSAPQHYTIQYESDDLDDAAALIRDCDVISVVCEGCCTLINDYLTELAAVNVPNVALSYMWNGDASLTITAHAYSTQITGQPPELVTIEGYVFNDPDSVVIAGSGDSRTFTPPSDWMGGVYSVTVTDSEGLVNTAYLYIHPTELKFRTEELELTNAGATVDLQLNEGESIASVIQITAGSGVMLESITYAGDPPLATLTFTGIPAVASVDLQLLIQR